MTILKLVSVDDRQGTRSARVTEAVIAVIKIVVDDDHRTVVPAQRSPAAIVMSPVPMHPGGPPGPVGNPVPAQAQPPVPAAVVICAPAPRLIRDPGPAAKGIPEPAAIIIGTPIIYIDAGDPDVSVGPFVDPAAVIGELVFVVFEVRGKIALRNVLAVEGVAVAVPAIEIVAPIGKSGAGSQVPARSQELLPASDEQGASLAGRLHGAFDNRQFGLAIFLHIETVESFLQSIERGVWSMKLKCLLLPEEIEPKIDRPFEEMDPNTVITLPGHIGELHEGHVIKSQEVLAAEGELRPASSCLELIALDQGQVDNTFFRPEVPGSQNHDMPLDVGEAGETVAVVAILLGEGEE